MKNLLDLLARFKLIENPSDRKSKVLSIIKEMLMVNLQEGSIDIEKDKVVIKVHPAIKNLIFLNQGRVLAEIQKQLPESYIKKLVFV